MVWTYDLDKCYAEFRANVEQTCLITIYEVDTTQEDIVNKCNKNENSTT